VDPRFVRFHLEGLNHFLPGSSQMVAVIKPTPYKADRPIPDTDFQSHFGGALGFMGRLDEWPPELEERARKHLEVFKGIRKFLAEDYYLLTPQPRTFGNWEGWQFHNPETNEGFVQAFRDAQSTEPEKELVLKGLAPNVNYLLTDPYSGDKIEIKGEVAMTDGIRFELAPESSRLYVYQAKR
jgi:hypothetical protein